MELQRTHVSDPKVGRFIGEDPLGFDEDVNFYMYAANNPVYFVDPSGLAVYPNNFVGPIRPWDFYVYEVGSIIYNETRSLYGPQSYIARACLARTVINSSDKYGARRNRRARTMSPKMVPPKGPQEAQAYSESQRAAQEAFDWGPKALDNSTHFYLSKTFDTSGRFGGDMRYILGPLQSSYRKGDCPKECYVDIYNNVRP